MSTTTANTTGILGGWATINSGANWAVGNGAEDGSQSRRYNVRVYLSEKITSHWGEERTKKRSVSALAPNWRKDFDRNT